MNVNAAKRLMNFELIWGVSLLVWASNVDTQHCHLMSFSRKSATYFTSHETTSALH